MRISDWSSDVCSSDLPVIARLQSLPDQPGDRLPAFPVVARHHGHPPERHRLVVQDLVVGDDDHRYRAQPLVGLYLVDQVDGVLAGHRQVDHDQEIGRAPSELQSLMRISYAVFCLKKKNKNKTTHNISIQLLYIVTHY